MEPQQPSTALSNGSKETWQHSQKPKGEVVMEQLTIVAEAMGEPLTASRLQIYAKDLSDLSVEQIVLACLRARQELKFFPKIAELRELAGVAGAQVDDGRPGPETAWALCPKDEYQSVVWTEEMEEASAIANKLLKSGDEVGARMAFRESYNAIVAKARADGRPVKWFASLGWDKSGRVAALGEAVLKQRISVEYATRLLGGEQEQELLNMLPAESQPKLLPGEPEPHRIDATSLAVVLARLSESKALPPALINAKPLKQYGPTDHERAEHVLRVREQAASFIRADRERKAFEADSKIDPKKNLDVTRLEPTPATRSGQRADVRLAKATYASHPRK
jgi:hypothetical protein